MSIPNSILIRAYEQVIDEKHAQLKGALKSLRNLSLERKPDLIRQAKHIVEMREVMLELAGTLGSLAEEMGIELLPKGEES